MQFNSLEYLLFLPAVIAAYFALPARMRWPLLLAASCLFYMAWRPAYLLLLLGTASADYLAALLIARTQAAPMRRAYLVLALVVNLGILFAFKYAGFFGRTATELFGWAGLSVALPATLPAFEAVLPLGLSFYTFQALSYIIDVYRRARPVESHYGFFLLYILFFPQLVAGPITRASVLLPQLRQSHAFDFHRVVAGLQLILWGLFKKVVIADSAALFVNRVYDHPAEFAGLPVLVATYLFAIQIYCDFSGYTDIALGSAQVLGYRLAENFRRPYAAASIAEFWQRWHISLTAWFRDYVFLPASRVRPSHGWRYLCLFLVFLLSGLWHGANWTFVIWGGLHGLFLAIGVMTVGWRAQWAQRLGLSRRPRLQRAVGIFATFHLVLFTWVFFRANTVSEAWLLLQTMLAVGGYAWPLPAALSTLWPVQQQLIVAAAIAVLFAVELAGSQPRLIQRAAQAPRVVRWGALAALVLAVMNLGQPNDVTFIYFQF